MPTPQQIALDLHDLWWVSKALREFADAHSSASSTVGAVGASYALDRPDTIGLGAKGYIADWEALQEAITTMLSTNAQSLRDSAHAMDLCIKYFTEQDEATMTEFNNRKAALPYD